jgi:(p)ppGpp synthase/HD superfamily hydrolase
MSTPATPYALAPVVLDDGCDAAEAAFRIESRASQLAHMAHDGQRDKIGYPYIRHVRQVAERLADPRDRALAWLHDVVEDTDVTLDDLHALNFPADLVAEVDAITHREHEPRGLYYARIRRAGDRVVRVKLADIDDNMDPLRRVHLDDADVIRLERKYTAARRMLLGLPVSTNDPA